LPTVAERFGDVDAADVLAACKIGYRAGDAQDAGVASCREPHGFGGLGEELAARFVWGGVGLQRVAVGFGIGADAVAGIAGGLDRAGGVDTRANLR
jgi:hypothetical protein